MKNLTAIIAGLALSLTAMFANAGLIIDGGTAAMSGTYSSAINDVIGNNGAGVIGGNLIVNSDRPGRVTFSFVGSEAAWNDQLHYFNVSNTIVNHPAGCTGVCLASGDAAYRQRFGVDVLPGQSLEFYFHSDHTGQNTYNGANSTTSPNFWMGYTPDQTGDVLIGFDDSGSGPDLDNDDLVVRASYKVPEPGSLALLGIGAIGLGLARRKN